MKIGLTISDNFEEYLKEIAKMNNTKVTTIVGYIVENFINYNQSLGRKPIFKKTMTLTYNEKNEKKDTKQTDTRLWGCGEIQYIPEGCKYDGIHIIKKDGTYMTQEEWLKG